MHTDNRGPGDRHSEEPPPRRGGGHRRWSRSAEGSRRAGSTLLAVIPLRHLSHSPRPAVPCTLHLKRSSGGCFLDASTAYASGGGPQPRPSNPRARRQHAVSQAGSVGCRAAYSLDDDAPVIDWTIHFRRGGRTPLVRGAPPWTGFRERGYPVDSCAPCRPQPRAGRATGRSCRKPAAGLASQVAGRDHILSIGAGAKPGSRNSM